MTNAKGMFGSECEAVMLPLVHTNMMQLLIMRKFRSHYA
jgi:hypothetical protein